MDKLTELLAALSEADQELKHATEVESTARGESSAARNKVNGLQKAIDREVAELRNKAEWNTDWHSQRQSLIPK